MQRQGSLVTHVLSARSSFPPSLQIRVIREIRGSVFAFLPPCVGCFTSRMWSGADVLLKIVAPREEAKRE